MIKHSLIFYTVAIAIHIIKRKVIDFCHRLGWMDTHNEEQE